MFSLGFPEIFLISSAVLLIFGPKKLPELAQGLGKAIRGFKKEVETKPEDTPSISHRKTTESKTSS